MKHRIRHVVHVILLLLLMPLPLHSEEIFGKWVQKHSFDPDFSKYYTFHDNGSFEVQSGSLQSSEYKIEHNVLIINDNFSDKIQPASKYFFVINDNVMSFRGIISENPLMLTNSFQAVRLPNPERKNDNSIVGKWTIVEDDGIEVIIEYTENGQRLFIIPQSYSKGVFAIKGDRLLLKFAGKEFENYSYSANELILSIYKNPTITERYRRIK